MSNLDTYTGWELWTPSESELGEFYTTGFTPFKAIENQYLLVQDSGGAIVDKRCYQRGNWRPVKFIKTDNLYTGSVKPRNPYQAIAMDMLADSTSKVKVVRGVYGSGKDFIMLSYALSQIQKGKFEKIVYIRPNVTVKGLPDIGALPGTADEKLAWTLGPFLDKVGGDAGINMLINTNQLEIVPLLYIRGRSFENSIVYMSEGQNMTTEIAKLVLGRIGEGSELYINGDTHQSDKRIFDEDNGISKMVERLSGNPLFSYVYLPVTERSAVANLANLLEDQVDF